VLTPAAASKRDALLLPSAIDRGPLPLRIASVLDLADSPAQLQALLKAQDAQPFLLSVRRARHSAQVALALRRDSQHRDVLTAVLAACIARHSLTTGAPCAGCLDAAVAQHCERWRPPRAAKRGGAAAGSADDACLQDAVREAQRILPHIEALLEQSGWQCQAFLLSQSERVKYSVGEALV